MLRSSEAASASKPAVARALLDRLERRPAPRGDPERPVAAVGLPGEVEIAGRAAGGDRGVDDRRDGLAGGLGFREPRRPVGVEPHRRPPVGDDDDRGRLVGETLSDDELVVEPCGRELCARAPVDRRDRVARKVGAKARHVAPASAPRARSGAEREARQPAPRNEREPGTSVRRARSTTGGRRSGPREPSRDAAAARARSKGRGAVPAPRRRGGDAFRQETPTSAPAGGRARG